MKAASTAGPAVAPAQVHSAAPPTLRPTATSRRCSRYQFECRSGGECVAVYNACDGVPQCADGSDEAPELGCPASPPPAPAAVRTPRPAPPPRPAAHRPLAQPGDYAPSKESGESPEGARWPHRLVQAQPAAYPDNGPSSHIFSHKGGLVQDADGGGGGGAGAGPFAPFEAAGAWPRRPWAHDGGLGLETGAGMGVRWGGGEFPRYEWPASAPDPRRAWPVPPPPALPQLPPQPSLVQEVGVNGYAAKTMPEMAAYPEPRHALHDGPKKGFGLTKSEPPAPPPVAPAPAPAPVVPPAAAPPGPTARDDNHKASQQTPLQKAPEAVVASGAGAAGGAGAFLDEHDGLSESPPAAVLLLVLGIAMTSALGVLVACRWRGARRRGRRRGPFAHDADYLVNGMYL